MPHITTAFISLGSNLGDRVSYLEESLFRLEQGQLSIGAVSPLYETAPIGGPPQGLFLNACVSFHTALSPVSLLRRLQQIETSLGRVRLERWGPRTIDLDLLIYGKVIMNTPVLELPHPRMHVRDFVLKPLSVIAPELIIPGIWKTVRHLLEERSSTAKVNLYRDSWYLH
ncbi:MAG: 2-amino-4-hydroxy-6-hydroxymethyldihydropteridine diphosphokinase [Firmicutes bacterium]|nr:2-amino-4-hydroxy-6-hydroxymethyldihydropteridine diphosphokinase [Bacillota bacterium]